MGKRLLQLLRFCTVGLVCLGLGVALLAGLHDLAGVNYLVAYVASFVITNIAGYLLNARFTFFAESVNRDGAARYMTINFVLLCANAGILKLLVDIAHVWYIAAAIQLAVINAPVGFFAQRLITYRLQVSSNAADI